MEDDLFTFCLVRQFMGAKGDIERVVWLEDGGDRWLNSMGGWMNKTSREEVLKTVRAECEDDLDHTKTSLYKELLENKDDDTLMQGWLSPDAEVHYCRYHDHDAFARLILKREVRDLEAENWCRFVIDPGGRIGHFGRAKGDWVGSRLGPTEDQAAWLMEDE